MKQKSIYILHFIILTLLVLFILFVPTSYGKNHSLQTLQGEESHFTVYPASINTQKSIYPHEARWPAPTEENLPKAKSGKWISVTATAYSKAETCPRETCITANGSEPIPFRTAACPRNIQFGRHFLVTGIERGGIYWNGIFVCTDRTSRRYDGRFDLFAPGHAEAIDFGKQKLTIFVYDEHSK